MADRVPSGAAAQPIPREAVSGGAPAQVAAGLRGDRPQPGTAAAAAPLLGGTTPPAVPCAFCGLNAAVCVGETVPACAACCSHGTGTAPGPCLPIETVPEEISGRPAGVTAHETAGAPSNSSGANSARPEEEPEAMPPGEAPRVEQLPTLIGGTTAMPASACPRCGGRLNATTLVDDGRGELPTPENSITLCFHCGSLLVFADDLRVREPTAQELAEVTGDLLAEVRRWQAAIAKRNLEAAS